MKKLIKDTLSIFKTTKGFTLIELLVVVLIIGILSAVAVPMYKKATEKSKVSEALLVMDTVAKGQQYWYMLKDSYTTNFANLSTDLIDKDGNPAQDDSYETNTYSYSLKETGILSERNNKEYMLYLDYETKQIMCIPSEHYICKDFAGLTEQPCKSANLSWANTNSTCYANDEARCKGLYDDSVWNGEFCGYKQTSGKTIDEGMECFGNGSGCNGSIINYGGICRGSDTWPNQWHNCNGSTVNVGGTCVATGQRSCNNVVVDGGECTGRGAQPCWNVTIKGGGVCTATDAESNSSNPTGCNSAKIYDGECKSDCRNSEVYKDGICSGKCWKSQVYEGGICSGDCSGATVNDGGVCSGGCKSATINDGGKCISSATNYCKSATYNGTGCCEGDYCGTKPKCA